MFLSLVNDGFEMARTPERINVVGVLFVRMFWHGVTNHLFYDV